LTRLQRDVEENVMILSVAKSNGIRKSKSPLLEWAF
jgi:hypothetical protein